MRRYLVVDGNNIAARHYCAMMRNKGATGLETSTGVKTTVIRGLLQSFANLPMSFDKVMVCWDGGSSYRKEMFPHYKANRLVGTSPILDLESYYLELDTARKYFEKMGINQMYVKGCEADDLIAVFVKRHLSDDCRVVIFSDDHDYFQMLSDKRLKIYRPTKGEFVSWVEGEEKLGYPPKIFNRIMALTGQEKDNIPGGCDLDENKCMKKYGFGEVAARKLLENPDGSYKKLREVKEILNRDQKHQAQLRRNWKRVLISYKLSKLMTNVSDFNKEHFKDIELALAKFEANAAVKASWIDQLGQFLEFKTFKLAPTLRKLGVNMK